MNNELASFVDLVKAMRDAQKKYFKTRAPSDLVRSKQLESQVDVQVKKLWKPRAETETPVAEQLPLAAETKS